MKLRELVDLTMNLDFCKVLSDSGWECGPTEVGTVFYSKKAQVIILGQDFVKKDQIQQYNVEYEVDDFVILK